MRKPEVGKREAAASLIASIAVILLYLASGVNYINAQGTCHTQQISCHGLPMGNQCIGVETSKTVFHQSSQCDQLDNIKERCTTARKTLCNTTEYTENEWKETPVQGFSCGEWENQYPEAVNLKSCAE